MIPKELNVKFGLEGVMGYFRPLMNFNKGKVSEYNERKCFNQKIAMEHIKEDAD